MLKAKPLKVKINEKTFGWWEVYLFGTPPKHIEILGRMSYKITCRPLNDADGTLRMEGDNSYSVIFKQKKTFVLHFDATATLRYYDLAEKKTKEKTLTDTASITYEAGDEATPMVFLSGVQHAIIRDSKIFRKGGVQVHRNTLPTNDGSLSGTLSITPEKSDINTASWTKYSNLESLGFEVEPGKYYVNEWLQDSDEKIDNIFRSRDIFKYRNVIRLDQIPANYEAEKDSKMSLYYTCYATCGCSCTVNLEKYPDGTVNIRNDNLIRAFFSTKTGDTCDRKNHILRLSSNLVMYEDSGCSFLLDLDRINKDYTLNDVNLTAYLVPVKNNQIDGPLDATISVGIDVDSKEMSASSDSGDYIIRK